MLQTSEYLLRCAFVTVFVTVFCYSICYSFTVLDAGTYLTAAQQTNRVDELLCKAASKLTARHLNSITRRCAMLYKQQAPWRTLHVLTFSGFNMTPATLLPLFAPLLPLLDACCCLEVCCCCLKPGICLRPVNCIPEHTVASPNWLCHQQPHRESTSCQQGQQCATAARALPSSSPKPQAVASILKLNGLLKH